MLWAVLLLILAVLSGTVLTWKYLESASLWTRLAGGSATGLVLWPWVAYPLALGAGLGTFDLVATLLALGLTVWLGRRRLRPTWPPVAYVLVAVAVVAVFARAASSRSAPGDPPGAASLWTLDGAELPFHLHVVTAFYPGGNLPPQDVDSAGSRFPGPFMVDFAAAQLHSAGASLVAALNWQDAAMALALFATVGVLAAAVAGDGRAGWLAVAVLLLGVPRWPLPEVLLQHRSLLLGLPCMLWVVYLWWRLLRMPAGAARDRLAGAAAVCSAGLWLVDLSTAVLLVLLGVALAAGFKLSWARPARTWAWLSALPLAWLLVGRSAPLARLFDWDRGLASSLAPCCLLVVPWLAAGLARLSRGPAAARVGAALCVALLCGPGAAPVWRLASGRDLVPRFSGLEVRFAEQVSRLAHSLTLPVVVLHAPTADSPLLLAGGLSVLGARTLGPPAATRAAAISAFYTGQPADVLRQYHVRFVAVTPQETARYSVQLQDLHTMIRWIDANGYQLYEVP